MGFLNELGILMKKYEVEIYSIQIDENIKRLNDKFHISLKREDLPPNLIVFKTKEGDYIPTNFGPLSLNNSQKNLHFINSNDQNKVLDLITNKTEVQEQKIINKKIFILGPMFGKQNCNEAQFNEFLTKNLQKLRSYNTSNNYIKQYVNEKKYKTGKITAKQQKKIIQNIEDVLKNYNILVLLNDWDKAEEVIQIVNYIKTSGIKIVREKDF